MRVRVHYILLFIGALIFSSCQEKLQDRFVREAREYTATQCPLPHDDFTVLDSLVFVPKGEAGDLRIFFSVILDEEQREVFMSKGEELRDIDKKVVRNSVQFSKYKEAGVTFVYIYHDKATGKKLTEIRIDKNDYK